MPSPWMTKLFNAADDDGRGSFRDRPLSRIALPGTHDSGCYVDQWLTNALSKTQNQDVYGQLYGGIRYFDIRPKVVGNNFYTYHGPFYNGGQIDGEQGILNQVKQFLLDLIDTDRELVILNISHFSKFTDESHQLLIRHIEATFGELLVPYTQNEIKLFGASYRKLLSERDDRLRSRVAVLYDGALDQPREPFIEGYIRREGCLPKGLFVLAPKYDCKGNNIYLFDQYANSAYVDDFEDENGYLREDGMQPDQFAKLTQRERYPFNLGGKWTIPEGSSPNWFPDAPGGVENTMHLLSWTLTPQMLGGNPIPYANERSNPRLLEFFSHGARWRNGASYDPGKDPQINIVYVDSYESQRHQNRRSRWNGLALPVAIAAQLNVGPVGDPSTW